MYGALPAVGIGVLAGLSYNARCHPHQSRVGCCCNESRCDFGMFSLLVLPFVLHRGSQSWRNRAAAECKTQDFNIIEEHRAAQRADMYLRLDKTGLEEWEGSSSG